MSSGLWLRLPEAMLDAELVVPTSEGRSDFEELRRRNLLQRPRMIKSAARRPGVLIAFDLLQIGDEDLRALPLYGPSRPVCVNTSSPCPASDAIEHIETHAEPLFQAIAYGDHEGIVAKRVDPRYRAGPDVPALVQHKDFYLLQWLGVK